MAKAITLKKGSFVRFTANDPRDGKFSFVGQITAVTPETVSMEAEAPYGTVGVENDPSKFTVARKPRGWKTPEPVVAPAKAKKSKKTRAKRSGTKLDEVVVLVRENADLSRKELIALVVDKIGMTPAGASTYVSNARKLVKN